MMIVNPFGELGLIGALFRGARYIHVNCVCFHIPTHVSLRSRDVLVQGSQQPFRGSRGGREDIVFQRLVTLSTTTIEFFQSFCIADDFRPHT
jgi:hypothetical protein